MPETTKKLRTWKLLKGVHNEEGRTYTEGDEITTHRDLEKLNNGGYAFQKFLRLDGKTPEQRQAMQSSNTSKEDARNQPNVKPVGYYEAMTKTELISEAEGREIELAASANKAEIIAILKEDDE